MVYTEVNGHIVPFQDDREERLKAQGSKVGGGEKQPQIPTAGLIQRVVAEVAGKLKRFFAFSCV